MNRKEFLHLTGGAAAGALTTSCGMSGTGDRPGKNKVVAVAFDGIDPKIVADLMGKGHLPNLEKLKQNGCFTKIATSTPPHTPVAFSSIISGCDPGVHQIFDFIHRDPNPEGSDIALRPHFSVSDSIAPDSAWALPIGSWQIPLSSGKTNLLRRGPAFWDYLIAEGIDTDIYYLPSNYPSAKPEGPGRFRCVSGMGTPDLLGGYGEFTLFTPAERGRGREVGGGRFSYLSMRGDVGSGELLGPPNFLMKPDAGGSVRRIKIPVRIVRDRKNPVAMIQLGNQKTILNEGEWSRWVPVTLPTGIPGSSILGTAGIPTSVRGMARLFLKSVHPRLELYVSPINIDPLAPVNPISSPEAFANSLAKKHGRYSTLGIPEDTKALSHGALDEDQFISQSDLVQEERVHQYREALKECQSGCLAFYFGATDLLQHMFWRDRDPQHPGRIEAQSQRFASFIDDIYIEMDGLVGEAMATIGPDDTLIVFSDHGFNSFRRGFNLNTWLAKNGFLTLKNGATESGSEMFADVRWAGSRAYGLGMNGLYLNLKDREKFGTVKRTDYDNTLDEITEKLLDVRDGDGTPVIERIDKAEKLYPGADPNIAPDLFIGYAEGYRASWETVLGEMPASEVTDNLDRWSGTHLISADKVPGMLFANRPLVVSDPKISDIAPTILDAFHIKTPPSMSGRPLLKT